LLTGIVETVLKTRAQHQYALEGFAAIALFDCVLFFAVGVLCVVGHHLCPRIFSLPGVAFLLAALAVNDWAQMLYSFHGSSWLLLISIVLVLAARSAYLFHRYPDVAMRLCRLTLPWMAAIVLLSALIPLGQRIAEQKAETRLPQPTLGRRNVIVIVVDTLRADHLTLYGYPRNTSPSLVRIAQQGVTFDYAIAPSSWTLPSHASMVTGRYPHEHGVENEQSVLNGHLPVIGEEFQKLGYRTAAFSANQSWFTRLQGFGRGFMHFEDFVGFPIGVAAQTPYGEPLVEIAYKLHRTRYVPGHNTAEDINQRALQWIDRDSRPFFVFLNYIDTHVPYLPVIHYEEQFVRPGHKGGRITKGDEILTPEELQDEMDAYDACIHYVDVQLQRLFDDLQRRRLGQNTIVVITSDHGEAFNEHGFFHHQNALYRELIHVPLVIWSPDHIPSALRITRPVSTAAIPSTLLSLVDAPPQDSFKLPPLSELWGRQGEVANWPYPISELARITSVPPVFPSFRGASQSLITSQWHLILSPDGMELYHCCDNDSEQHNLAETNAGREVAMRLSEEFSRESSGTANTTDSLQNKKVSRFKPALNKDR
jgi:arylsulfatase A-like enzyme